jgi:anti-sigma B factor antagonist
VVRGGFEIVLRGDVDAAVRASTMDAIEQACVVAIGDDVDLVVDVSGVSFMDSSGLACLSRATALLSGPDRLRIRGPQPHVRRVLELAGFDRLIEGP